MIALPKEPMPVPQTDPSVVFIDRHINDVHAEFGQLKPTYSAEKGKFIEPDSLVVRPIQETEEMRRQQTIFLAAVAKFEKSNKGVKLGLRLDQPSEYGFDDVIKQLQTAQDKYDRGGDEGSGSRIRKCLRKMRRWRAPCEQWLKFLPTESWQTSILCGGMKMVLGAAFQMELMREEVTESIEQIPFTIDIVYRLSKAYDSEAMQSHMSQLFVAILELLQECLVWLTKNPFRKSLSAAFKSDEHSAALIAKRDALEKLENRVDRFAGAGLHERVKDIDDRVRTGSDVLNRLLAFVSGDKEALIAEVERSYEESQRQLARNVRLERQLSAAIESNKRSLLQDVDYRPQKHEDELLQSLRAGSTTYVRAQDRAAWILRSGQISAWLLDSSSQVLVINSHEATHDRQSPVSLFSALLARSLVQSKAGVVIYWSCALNVHSSADDIVRDAIGQMLVKGASDLSLAVMLADRKLDHEDSEDLVTLFVCLLRAQLEKGPVYMIVDSISFYEDRQRLPDTRYLFDELYALADERDGRHQLKFLATSPTRCSYFGTLLDEWKPTVLSVPAVVEGQRLRRMSQIALPGIGAESDSE